jgi:peroxiredoxin
MRRALASFAFFAMAFAAIPVLADPPGLKPLAIGSPAPDFRLPGVDGKTYGLKDFADAKVLVVAFTCNHCPTANAYEERFKKFTNEYKTKGVAFVAISPNDPKAVRLDELGYSDLDDSFESMKIRALDHKYNFPYLYDGDTQATSRAYGVLATPHMFIFDADRKLRYQGRFDDSEAKVVNSHDAINAVDAILSGSKVAVETNRVFGCSTKWADKQESARQWLAKADAEPVELKEIDGEGVAKLARNEMKKEDGKQKYSLLLVNVWATWCGPCVEEMPELVEMYRMFRGRGFGLATISLDDPAKRDSALDMLKKNHASALNYISKVESQDKLAEALDKEWPGPVPYTILVAPGGKVIYRKSGGIDPLEVKRAIVGYLGRTY